MIGIVFFKSFSCFFFVLVILSLHLFERDHFGKQQLLPSKLKCTCDRI